MAERISDPVNRLTRATRRIARGDLDARVAATSSDELGRLVEDFNSMARDLQRQRTELERTNRLEAWAEMARQVAHEIKNPLTPIQLNAEHLRRVHADRGEPLSPVLQECVATILTQVRLLRQIASEFSSFASSPTARPTAVDVPELLDEVVSPYRAGLSERIRFDVDVPRDLPRVLIDRTLIARSLTNIVENALHAMPSAGTLGVAAHADDHHVRIRISDTRRRHGPGSTRARVRAVFLDQGDGHGARAADRQAQRRVDGRNDRGDQRARPRNDGRADAARRPAYALRDLRVLGRHVFVRLLLALRRPRPQARPRQFHERRQQVAVGEDHEEDSGCAAMNASAIATSSSTV